MNFLKKLIKQGKIKIVEPSEEVKEAYQKRAEESLESAKTLCKINNLSDSVALAYYAMYHELLALFFKTGIKCENHKAGIELIKKLFDIDNEEIKKAKKERIDKQYYIDFEINKEQTEKAIKTAEDFINKIMDFTEKLNMEEIEKAREKLKSI